MMTLTCLPAFDDNYIWVLHDDRYAIAIDPGDPAPLLDWLDARCLRLAAIFNTHHHRDHTGGNRTLRARTQCEVYAPDNPAIPAVTQRVYDGDQLRVAGPGLTLTVKATPGHTLDHVCYQTEDLLFCGDTLFSVGCGRLFEGDARMMTGSLDWIMTLPDATRICCAHEYTLENLAYARMIDPENAALIAREHEARAQRAAGRPTLPVLLASERACNPFLRLDAPVIQALARAETGCAAPERHAVFAALRTHKDRWDARSGD